MVAGESFLKGLLTVVVEAAWAVNFSTRLRSFIKDHISGRSLELNEQ